MRGALFDPAGLAGLSQLQHLELEDCYMVPAHQSDQAQATATAATAATQDQPTLLLEALESMQQLQHLVLLNSDNHHSGSRRGLIFAAMQPCRLSALTASSKLTCLSIGACLDAPLPPAALQHMFPAGKCLPVLAKLRLSCECRPHAENACMEVADLQCIVSACPALCTLDLTSGVCAGPGDVSALLQLPDSCCSLDVSGPAFRDAAASIISQLTQLTWLSWLNSPGLSDAGLDQLTALQSLQHFCMDDLYDLSADVAPKDSEGLPPDAPLALSANATVSTTRIACHSMAAGHAICFLMRLMPCIP